MRRARAHWDRDAGFSLAETLVAMALVALAVGLLAQSGSTGFRGLQLAAEAERIGALARSLLASIGPERPLVPGRLEGVDPLGDRWVIAIEPYQPPSPLPSRVNAAGYRVTVTVTAPGLYQGGSLTVSTIKVGERLP